MNIFEKANSNNCYRILITELPGGRVAITIPVEQADDIFDFLRNRYMVAPVAGEKIAGHSQLILEKCTKEKIQNELMEWLRDILRSVCTEFEGAISVVL